MSPISLKSNRQSTPAIHFSTKKACLTYIAGREGVRIPPDGIGNPPVRATAINIWTQAYI
jgi:hypothetical protein